MAELAVSSEFATQIAGAPWEMCVTLAPQELHLQNASSKNNNVIYISWLDLSS